MWVGGQSHRRAGSLGSQALSAPTPEPQPAQPRYQVSCHDRLEKKEAATHHPTPSGSWRYEINSGEDGEAGDKGADELNGRTGRVQEKWALIKCR